MRVLERDLTLAREQNIPLAPTLVAKRDVKRGAALLPDNIGLIQWPVDSLPEGAFVKLGELFSQGPSIPRVALSTIPAGQPIVSGMVSEPGGDAGLSSRLARGMRAFSLRVDVTSGVSGFLRPGDRVDVYWTGHVANESERPGGAGAVTKLIEAGVELVAIDQSAGGDLAGALIERTVTVAARPQQVAALAQAQSTGRLSLSLVGAGDDVVAAAIEVDLSSLLGIEPEAVVEKERGRICTIRTRRGGELLEIPIPCSPDDSSTSRYDNRGAEDDGSEDDAEEVEKEADGLQRDPDRQPQISPDRRNGVAGGVKFDAAPASVSIRNAEQTGERFNPFVNSRLANTLEYFQDGSIAYNAPEVMSFQVWQTIQLALVPSGADKLVAELISPDLEGEVISVELPSSLTSVMSAELQGAAFEVAPSGLQSRTIVDDRPTLWTWEVRPKEFGSKKILTLTLFAEIDGTGSSPPSQIESIVRTIEVDVGLWSRILFFVSSANSLLSFGTAAGAAVAAFLTWLASLRLRKPKTNTTAGFRLSRNG